MGQFDDILRRARGGNPEAANLDQKFVGQWDSVEATRAAQQAQLEREAQELDEIAKANAEAEQARLQTMHDQSTTRMGNDGLRQQGDQQVPTGHQQSSAEPPLADGLVRVTDDHGNTFITTEAAADKLAASEINKEDSKP